MISTEGVLHHLTVSLVSVVAKISFFSSQLQNYHLVSVVAIEKYTTKFIVSGFFSIFFFFLM